MGGERWERRKSEWEEKKLCITNVHPTKTKEYKVFLNLTRWLTFHHLKGVQKYRESCVEHFQTHRLLLQHLHSSFVLVLGERRQGRRRKNVHSTIGKEIN